jgi:hypothetical protein
MDAGGEGSWWQWLGGLAFTAVSGLFLFTHRRIGEVRTELRSDQLDEVTALRTELKRMEQSMEAQFAQGRQDRAEMWHTIQTNQAEQVKQHAQNLERLRQIPTRDEMMQMLQQFLFRTNTQH